MSKKELDDELVEDIEEEIEDPIGMYDDETSEEEIVEEVKEENKSETKSQATTTFEKTIDEYLKDYALRDSAFQERLNNPEKNIKDCCNYIINQVRKSGCNGFADEEVYKMARDYYVDDIDPKDLKNVGSGTVVVNHQVELTEEEKMKVRVEAMRKLEQEILEEERKKREAEEKVKAKEEEKARKKEEARIKKEEEKKAQEELKRAQELAEAKANGGGEQMSLFDMLGD